MIAVPRSIVSELALPWTCIRPRWAPASANLPVAAFAWTSTSRVGFCGSTRFQVLARPDAEQPAGGVVAAQGQSWSLPESICGPEPLPEDPLSVQPSPLAVPIARSPHPNSTSTVARPSKDPCCDAIGRSALPPQEIPIDEASRPTASRPPAMSPKVVAAMSPPRKSKRVRAKDEADARRDDQQRPELPGPGHGVRVDEVRLDGQWHGAQDDEEHAPVEEPPVDVHLSRLPPFRPPQRVSRRHCARQSCRHTRPYVASRGGLHQPGGASGPGLLAAPVPGGPRPPGLGRRERAGSRLVPPPRGGPRAIAGGLLRALLQPPELGRPDRADRRPSRPAAALLLRAEGGRHVGGVPKPADALGRERRALPARQARPGGGGATRAGDHGGRRDAGRGGGGPDPRRRIDHSAPQRGGRVLRPAGRGPARAGRDQRDELAGVRAARPSTDRGSDRPGGLRSSPGSARADRPGPGEPPGPRGRLPGSAAAGPLRSMAQRGVQRLAGGIAAVHCRGTTSRAYSNR